MLQKDFAGASADLQDFGVKDYLSAGEDALEEEVIYENDNQQLLQLLQNSKKTAGGVGQVQGGGLTDFYSKDDALTLSKAPDLRTAGQIPVQGGKGIASFRQSLRRQEGTWRSTQSQLHSDDLASFDCPADWEDGPSENVEGAPPMSEDPELFFSLHKASPLVPGSQGQCRQGIEPETSEKGPPNHSASGGESRLNHSPHPDQKHKEDWTPGTQHRTGLGQSDPPRPTRDTVQSASFHGNLLSQPNFSQASAGPSQSNLFRQNWAHPGEQAGCPESTSASQQVQPSRSSQVFAHPHFLDPHCSQQVSQDQRGRTRYKGKAPAKPRPKFTIKSARASEELPNGDPFHFPAPVPGDTASSQLAKHGSTLPVRPSQLSSQARGKARGKEPAGGMRQAGEDRKPSLASQLQELTGQPQASKAPQAQMNSHASSRAIKVAPRSNQPQQASTQRSSAAQQQIEEDIGDFNEDKVEQSAEPGKWTAAEAGLEVVPTPTSSLMQRFRDELAASGDHPSNTVHQLAPSHTHRLPVTSFHGALQRVLQLEKERKAHLAKIIETKRSMPEGVYSQWLDVRILSVALEAHITKCHCQVLHGPQDPTIPSDPLSATDQRQGHVHILFNAKDFPSVGLEVETIIRIHPPWREVVIQPASQRVIMCTTFAEKLPRGMS